MTEDDTDPAALHAQALARRAEDPTVDPGSEAALAEPLDGILGRLRRPEIDTTAARRAVERVRRGPAPVAAPVSSRVPGGALVHRAVGRLVARHVAPVHAAHTAALAEIADCCETLVGLIEAQREADERQLHDVLAGVLDRLALLDRIRAELDEQG